MGGPLISNKLAVAGLLAFLLSGASIVAAASANSPVATTESPRTTQTTLEMRKQGSANARLGTETDISLSVTSTLRITSPVKAAISIARYFSVPVTSVMELHVSGWGFGGIFKLYNYAKLSGQSVESIQAMREVEQMGWGQIAKTFGLHPGNKGNNLGGIISGRNVVSGTSQIHAAQHNKPHSKQPVKVNPGNKNKP